MRWTANAAAVVSEKPSCCRGHCNGDDPGFVEQSIVQNPFPSLILRTVGEDKREQANEPRAKLVKGRGLEGEGQAKGKLTRLTFGTRPISKSKKSDPKIPLRRYTMIFRLK